MNQLTSIFRTARQISFYAVEFTLVCGGIYLLTAANHTTQLPFLG
mgnify:CR=1|jgi:hypothetical protein